jgi:nucleoporin POM34
MGSPSPLGVSVSSGASLFGGDAVTPGTPSPMGGKKSSVGLNNKWLYDRSKRSGNSPLY